MVILTVRDLKNRIGRSNIIIDFKSDYIEKATHGRTRDCNPFRTNTTERGKKRLKILTEKFRNSIISAWVLLKIVKMSVSI